MGKRMYRRGTKAASLVLAVLMILPVFGCKKKKKDIRTGLTYDGESFWVNEDEKYASLVTSVQNVCHSYNIPMSLLIATDQDVILAAGLISLETDGKTKVNPYSVYEMGSVTKTFTAVAIMQLVEKGELQLSDTLDKFWPEYRSAASISVDDLLRMQSGLVDYQGEIDYGLENPTDILHDDCGLTDDQLVEGIFTKGVRNAPKSSMEYCNTNYYLLALIIEKITGKTYDEYLKKNIFKPCGMDHTSSCTKGDITCGPDLDDLAPEFLEFAKEFTDENLNMDCVHIARGCGDVHSCTADMLAFDRALMSGKLISQESLDLMMDFDMETITENVAYGRGLYKQNRHFGHSGNTMRYNTANVFVDTQKYGRLYIICLIPRDGMDADALASMIADAL